MTMSLNTQTRSLTTVVEVVPARAATKAGAGAVELTGQPSGATEEY